MIEDTRKHKPNGVETQCQCVRSHDTLIDGDLEQCISRRDKNSNLFCVGCEELHGEYSRREIARMEAEH